MLLVGHLPNTLIRHRNTATSTPRRRMSLKLQMDMPPEAHRATKRNNPAQAQQPPALGRNPTAR